MGLLATLALSRYAYAGWDRGIGGRGSRASATIAYAAEPRRL